VTEKKKIIEAIPLLVPHSYLTTESNKTGSWRFLKPRYEEKTSPCSTACPAGEDIGRIEMLTTRGLFKEAWETILRENPFPGACGRVCYHPCEKTCNREEFDKAVAIHSIERFLADNAIRNNLNPLLERNPAREQKIAVIGAGPSGLAAAYFLTLLGYTCDVFEAMPEPGGILRWGIPLYRLPPSVLQNEIARIEDHGVRIHTGKQISQRFLEDTRNNYNAIFLGCGHSRAARLNIPGEDIDGVEDGLKFLLSIRQNKNPSSNGTVAVIGGGNTAVDVARSIVRLGGKALIIYRRRRQDMPAFEQDVRMALEEGVEIKELLTPAKIIYDNKELVLTLRQMKVVGEDIRGRALVEPDGKNPDEIRVERIFKAIGEETAEPWHSPPEEGEGILSMNNSVLAYRHRGPALVFGGDLTNQTKSVVHAVASGKEAAIALDIFFREGFDAIGPTLKTCMVGNGTSPLSMEIYMGGARRSRSPHIVTYEEINTDYFQLTAKVSQPRLLIEERLRTFEEVDLKISAHLATREAGRCFNCGLCIQCENCFIFCPDMAVIRDNSSQGRHINYDYCKGCGVCVVECPRNAMVLEEESYEESSGGKSGSS